MVQTSLQIRQFLGERVQLDVTHNVPNSNCVSPCHVMKRMLKKCCFTCNNFLTPPPSLDQLAGILLEIYPAFSVYQTYRLLVPRKHLEFFWNQYSYRLAQLPQIYKAIIIL